MSMPVNWRGTPLVGLAPPRLTARIDTSRCTTDTCLCQLHELMHHMPGDPYYRAGDFHTPPQGHHS